MLKEVPDLSHCQFHGGLDTSEITWTAILHHSNIPNVNFTVPSHIQHDFRRPIDIWHDVSLLLVDA